MFIRAQSRTRVEGRDDCLVPGYDTTRHNTQHTSSTNAAPYSNPKRRLNVTFLRSTTYHTQYITRYM